MHDRSPFRAIVLLLLALAGAAAIGVGAYQAGVQHGFVEAGRTAAAPVEGTSHIYVVPGAWHGAWYGGFFPLFPLVVAFVLLAFVVRGRGWRGRGGCASGDRRGRGGDDRVPPAFEAWHRRAHERMAGSPPPVRTDGVGAR
jgi:hypothetical protein